MKFFVDSANIEEITKLKHLGLADGVTTNPSLILKAGRNFQVIAKDICELIEGPVSLEVSSSSIDQMREESEKLKIISENVQINANLNKGKLNIEKLSKEIIFLKDKINSLESKIDQKNKSEMIFEKEIENISDQIENFNNMILSQYNE